MRDRRQMTRVELYLLLAVILLAGCPRDRQTARRADTMDQDDRSAVGYVPAEQPRPPGRAGQGVADAEVAVGMTNLLRYEPQEVTITVGQTVVWTNTSGMGHTVTADPKLAKDPSHVRLPEGAQPFNSGDMPPGATFRHTFDVPGQYVYFCIPHEAAGMVGRVNVQEKQ